MITEQLVVDFLNQGIVQIVKLLRDGDPISTHSTVMVPTVD